MAFFLGSFLRNEDGAVTADWVVLTAGIMGLSMLVVAGVQEGSTTLSQRISDATTVILP